MSVALFLFFREDKICLMKISYEVLRYETFVLAPPLWEKGIDRKADTADQ